jgi:hypothetical protein
MIIFTQKALKIILKKKIESIYINIIYVMGPCNENLCKMIPKIEITTSPVKTEYVLYQKDPIKVFINSYLYEKIIKHDDRVLIKYSVVRGKFMAEGITYSF